MPQKNNDISVVADTNDIVVDVEKYCRKSESKKRMKRGECD